MDTGFCMITDCMSLLLAPNEKLAALLQPVTTPGGMAAVKDDLQVRCGPMNVLAGLVTNACEACGHTLLLLREVGEPILSEFEAQVQSVVVLDALHVGLVCSLGSGVVVIVHLVVRGLGILEGSKSQSQRQGDHCCLMARNE